MTHQQVWERFVQFSVSGFKSQVSFNISMPSNTYKKSIPIIDTRRSNGRLFFIIRISILGRRFVDTCTTVLYTDADSIPHG